MNNNNGHDWGNILVLWSSMFFVCLVTVGIMDGTIDNLLGSLMVLTIATVAGELVGR